MQVHKGAAMSGALWNSADWLSFSVEPLRGKALTKATSREMITWHGKRNPDQRWCMCQLKERKKAKKKALWYKLKPKIPPSYQETAPTHIAESKSPQCCTFVLCLTCKNVWRTQHPRTRIEGAQWSRQGEKMLLVPDVAGSRLWPDVWRHWPCYIVIMLVTAIKLHFTTERCGAVIKTEY